MERIKVCADPFPPYQYIGKNGKPEGSDYEFVVSRLRMAGYEPEVCIAPWDRIYQEFQEQKHDALFQAQDLEERVEKYYFSKLLRYAVTEVITTNKALTMLTKYTELTNCKVGIIAGFANGAAIDSLPDSCKVEFPGTKEILQGIYHHKVDCGVCDQGVKAFLMAEQPALYSISALTYKRPLYVMFHQKKHRDDFDAAAGES